MSDFIPYGKQTIDEADIRAVVDALNSDFLTCGPLVDEFENVFAEFVGAKYAVVVSNATTALHLAMLVANVGEGDRIITSPNTFLSSANCAAFVGATPDFCDIDPDTYVMDARSLEEIWTADIKAVVPVAFAGQSADMKAIAKIAHSRGAIVIEDACHGTGGGFIEDGKLWKQGGHPWADMTTFSFHPVKTLTTGEGGILVTDNKEYAQRAKTLRMHGMTRDSSEFKGLGSDEKSLSEKGPWYYEMHELGYNYRITDFQCALGLSQLAKLPRFVTRRREIVDKYNVSLGDIELLSTPKVARAENVDKISWHLYTILIDFEKLGKTRTQVMNELREQNVGTQVLYIPVYLQPYYRKAYGYVEGKCPRSEEYYSKALSLPLYPSMSDADVDTVITAVKQVIKS